ncbi:hypothetical protein BLNAU_6027 [Blattamonas nauphoetae]|uniref:Protein kinase domain-containing protein n=1 Tax=Blattamonas nauphoetae TaxID=2049346 RepID=A0ABQ9Y5J7_9EUKA|nr:hypothetical protein BLNAU_6027 [Blattamonas nauphoetae]
MTATMKELSGEELVGSGITLAGVWCGSCLTSLVIADTPSDLDPNVTFTVPDEPARVESATPTLTPLRTSVIVKLSGRELESGSYSVTLSSHPSNPFSTTSTNGVIEFEVSTVTSDTIHLGFGDNFTVAKVMHGFDEVFVNSEVTFTVPDAPIVKTAQVNPNSISTTMTLDLAGTDLELDGFYTVTLSPPFSLDMLFNSSTTASSAELLLGRAEGLQHNTKYTIVSVARIGNDSDVILTEGTVSFTTPKSRFPLILHVNGKEGEDDAFCGESDDPCATIDFTWSIVIALNAKTSTLAIVNSSEQTQPIMVSSGMSILLSNGGNLEPTLTITSSASMGDKSGMVVVDDAGFEVDDVAIRIESSTTSFVFLSATDSTVILKEGSFIGEPLPTLFSNSDNEELCSWDNGIIRLVNCNVTLSRMTFSSLSQGAIHMKKGSISIESSSLHNHSPNLDSFPSARRNIRCVEGGNVTVESLSGGDGSTDKHPHLWISTTDCTLSGEDARRESPLFIPTLSSESSSSWNKKEKRFSFLIVGTTLIPCDLCLEVFEMKKDKSEGESERVELTIDTASSFTETHINLSIPLTSLSSLDKSLEWRGRLVFGSNQTTSEWFVVQKNSADRLAESSLANMKWWLPLIIVLLCCALVVVIVVVVILRRRQKQKAQKASEAQQESVIEMDEEKMDAEQLEHKRGVNTIRTSAGVLKGGSLDPEKGDESRTMETKLMNAPLAECVSVLDCSLLETKEMLKMETLFDRLHGNKKGLIEKRRRQVELARGLQKLGKLNSHAEVLCRLSSHWILLDAEGRMNIQMNRGSIPSLGQSSHLNPTAANESVVPEDFRSMTVNNENADGMDGAAKMVREKEDQEGQRWQAPEQGGNEALQSSDLEKVTVFRLGLVLWEMETGQVPFRETDGVNTGRQLKLGVKPISLH